MPAYWQQSSAPSIDVEMLTLRPRSSSLMRLTNFSALSRLSKTAAHVVTSVRPSTTAWKSGVLSRDPVRERVHLTRRPDRAAVPRVAQVDRLVLERDLQEASAGRRARSPA